MDRQPIRTHRSHGPGSGVNALSSRIAVVANDHRAVAVVLLLFLSLSTMPAGAGRYVLIKQSAPGESYAYSDVPGGVCEAYEKNLARFAYEPYGMACGRKLDPALGFTRPRWERLDPWKHQELMKEINRVQGWNRPVDIDPNDWEGLLKRIIEWGLVVELARVDLDGDGKPENIVRTGKKDWPCDAKEEIKKGSMGRKRMMIVDPALTKVEATIIPPDDVFLYKGRVYSDALYGFGFSENVRRKEGRDAELFLFGFLRYGAGAQCKFHYYAAPHIKPELKGRSKP